MGIWKNVVSGFGGVLKQAGEAVVSEPLEIARDMVGQRMEQGVQATQNTSDPTGNDPLKDLAKAGFRTQEDFQQYQGLSEKKDEKELEIARKQLVQEWGLDTNLESGMKKAQIEWEQKEKQRIEVKEKEVEQKKEFEFQKQKSEDAQVMAAQQESNPENKAWGAG